MPKRKKKAEKSFKLGPITSYNRTKEGKVTRKKKKKLPKGKTAGYPMSYLSNKKTKTRYLDKASGIEYEVE